VTKKHRPDYSEQQLLKIVDELQVKGHQNLKSLPIRSPFNRAISAYLMD
jgi:hypothetical protein